MIFLSTDILRKKSILEIIVILEKNGIKNLELTGGTQYEEYLLKKVFELKKKLGLNLQLHNYFPPPATPFIINLASANSQILQASIDHCKKAIDFSLEVGASRFAVHAGFRMDLSLDELGGNAKKKELVEKEEAETTFLESVRTLKEYCPSEFTLYFENNVYSLSNFQKFGADNPFLLVNSSEYQALNAKEKFCLLLDVAHLKVSCNVNNIDFIEELKICKNLTDYFHISDNSGLEDQNLLPESGGVIDLLVEELVKINATITLEVRDNIEKVIEYIKKHE